jgi:hypothetical protein
MVMETLTRSELEGVTAELLPSREALSWITVNIANVTAVNMALAVNAGTYGSVADAVALQEIYVFQG